MLIFIKISENYTHAQTKQKQKKTQNQKTNKRFAQSCRQVFKKKQKAVDDFYIKISKKL